jgi:hypothetical protein
LKLLMEWNCLKPNSKFWRISYLGTARPAYLKRCGRSRILLSQLLPYTNTKCKQANYSQTQMTTKLNAWTVIPKLSRL